MPWTFADVLIAAVPLLLLTVFGWIGAVGTPPPPREATETPGTGAVVVGVLVIAVVGLLWGVALFASVWMRIAQRYPRSWFALGARPARRAEYLRAFLWALAVFVVALGTNRLDALLRGTADAAAYVRRLPDFPGVAGPVAFALLLVFGIVGGCLFALIQLGVGYGWLRSRLPAAPAILVYAVVVALLVPPRSPLQLLNALVVALAEAWLFERTRSLFVCIAFGVTLLVLNVAVIYLLPR